MAVLDVPRSALYHVTFAIVKLMGAVPLLMLSFTGSLSVAHVSVRRGPDSCRYHDGLLAVVGITLVLQVLLHATLLGDFVRFRRAPPRPLMLRGADDVIDAELCAADEAPDRWIPDGRLWTSLLLLRLGDVACTGVSCEATRCPAVSPLLAVLFVVGLLDLLVLCGGFSFFMDRSQYRDLALRRRAGHSGDL